MVEMAGLTAAQYQTIYEWIDGGVPRDTILARTGLGAGTVRAIKSLRSRLQGNPVKCLALAMTLEKVNTFQTQVVEILDQPSTQGRPRVSVHGQQTSKSVYNVWAATGH